MCIRLCRSSVRATATGIPLSKLRNKYWQTTQNVPVSSLWRFIARAIHSNWVNRSGSCLSMRLVSSLGVPSLSKRSPTTWAGHTIRMRFGDFLVPVSRLPIGRGISWGNCIENNLFYHSRFSFIGHFKATVHPEVWKGNSGTNDPMTALGCNQVSNLDQPCLERSGPV